MDTDYPDFESAAARFREFLAAQGWPATVAWVLPGDVIIRRGKLFVRSESVQGAEGVARHVYVEGARRQLGVCLEAICSSSDRSFARVARPVSEDAASRLLFPDGLKLSIPASKSAVKVVSGWWRWWWLKRHADQWPDDSEDIEA